MKTPLAALIASGFLAACAQTPASAPTAMTPSAPVANNPLPAPVAAAANSAPDAPVYPGSVETLETEKAGILGIRGIDIPRYTQSSPLPNPPPARPQIFPAFPHDPKLPTIWTIGDSTVRTGYNGAGDDRVGQWGWGAPLVAYFDAKKVNVVNRAAGGTTSASFYNGPWKSMVDLIKPGDVVIMQFGTNSGRGELPGIGDESQPGAGGAVNHTYGWFIRQFIADTRARGATPIVCSLIPRNGRDPATGKITRAAATQAGWAKQVAVAEGVGFIDLNELVARKYDAMDRAEVDKLFSGSPHTSWAGAVVNAETVISGLKALKDDPVAPYFVEQVKLIPAAPTDAN